MESLTSVIPNIPNLALLKSEVLDSARNSTGLCLFLICFQRTELLSKSNPNAEMYLKFNLALNVFLSGEGK